MKVRRQKKSSPLIIAAVFLLVLLGMGTLLLELWKLQVPQKGEFEAEFVQQSVRRIRLPAVRGKIYDANGVCLADSVPNYCIAIYTEEMRASRSPAANTLALVHEIWARVGRPPDISYHDILRHLQLTPDAPLVAWKNLDDASIARWRKAFEIWTAPNKGLRRRQVPGLDLGHPVQGRSIVLQTKQLRKRGTTTAANTLELVYKISERLNIPRQVTFQQIKDHIYARRPLPLLAWKHIDDRIMARWADAASELKGSDIYCMADRYYPIGKDFSHLIGFTLSASSTATQTTERVHFDLRGLVGKKGLEGTYNSLLEGKPGTRLVQIDVAGFHYRDLQTRLPQPGGDLELSMDTHIQRFANEALALRQKGEDPSIPVRGAVVVLNPANGDVLALASSPSFDPNAYMNSKSYRQALRKDPYSRSFNRAVFGQYPPGSTFKPIAALGVLKEHPGFAQTNYVCNGFLRVSKRKMKCWAWRSGGHGEVSLRQALMHSCNVYMFEMVLATGYAPIYAMARQFGLGQYVGLFPELGKPPVQKNKKYGNLPATAQNDIDRCNLAIGQGAITASPLQMAMVAMAIANGGILFRPRLIKRWRTAPDAPWQKNLPWAIRKIDLPDSALELVRGGMYDVVEDPDGTAKKARVEGVNIAGKTGSAQYRKREGDKVVTRVYTWMISFAPAENPRYAVAMLVEDGVSGGNTVGPRLSALYQKIFEYDGTLPKGGAL